jgi:transposase-like protein
MNDEVPVKHWAAKRKSALVIDIFKGKTTPVEVARQHDLTVAEVECWVEEVERNMEYGFRTRPREALGDAHLQIYALKKYRRLLDDEENS